MKALNHHLNQGFHHFYGWAYLGSNQGPTDYESVALTN